MSGEDINGKPDKYFLVILSYLKNNENATISELKFLLKKLGFDDVPFYQSREKPNFFEGFKMYKNLQPALKLHKTICDENYGEYLMYWKKRRKNHEPEWSILSGRDDWVWGFRTKKEMLDLIKKHKKSYDLQRII